MKAKYHIITGDVTHEVPNEDIKNWGDVKFTLERKDFSGVMRSFSSEFEFVGRTYTLLRDLYLADGFLADAVIVMSTKNNDWTYTEQFRCPLDFSSVEIAGGVLTINAIDNSLAARIKSMKGQKWQFPVENFEREQINIRRITFANFAKYNLPVRDNAAGNVNATFDEENSAVISTMYVEPCDEVAGAAQGNNRFFAKINTAPSPSIRINWYGRVRKRLIDVENNNIAELQLGYWVDDNDPHFQLWSTLCNNDISKEFRYGSIRNRWIGGQRHANYTSLDALKAAAASNDGIIGLYPGYFGVVGSNAYPSAAYWTDNVVYMYQGNGNWISRVAPGDYMEDLEMSASATLSELGTDMYPMLRLTNSMTWFNSTMEMTWNDEPGEPTIIGGISPLELLQRIVSSISEGATASIDADSNGVIAKTYIFAAEALRKLPEAKIYTTFQQFADWMETVFGYTYTIEGNTVRFLHRSEVFVGSSVKVIERVRDVKYSVNDSLIYTEVDAGYSKKEYGEIDGRLETNFTNYYSTGYHSTDKKLSLISKYRADGYGIEFTLRKGEKDNETTDNRADEDVFFACANMVSDGQGGQELSYALPFNSAYAPYVCATKNAAFIAAMGNGAAVTLTMTSSDGNNVLSNIPIPAGTALFTAGELEFTTDDMLLPAEWNGLIQVDHKGYRYTGFISKAEASVARQGGMEYTLIVKEITAL